jgi:lipopolysaccharide export system protein LptA
MKAAHKMHISCLFAAVVALTTLNVAIGQTDSSSSLKELDSNSLLGGSINNKEFGKLPTHITSDTLTLNNKTRIFVYKGNVVVKQGDMTLTSKEVEGAYSEQNEIQKIIAKGDVVIVKQDITSTSQRATYDALNSVITLSDNPQLRQGESTLIADRIKVFLNDNRSQAEGNVRVTFVKQETPSPAPTSSSSNEEKTATPNPDATPAATANATPTATAKSTPAKSTPAKSTSAKSKDSSSAKKSAPAKKTKTTRTAAPSRPGKS